MKNVYSSVLECIGATPLIRMNRVNPNPAVTLYGKWEARNPGGSIKDRPALYMIETAEREGVLTHDKIIIEATSGNTGIGLAVVAAVKGYRILFAMPETASLERQKILKALGAELLLTPGSMGTDGSIEKVYNLVRENPNRYFMPDQFNNPANPAAHQYGTGPEIYEQTDGKVTAVVVALGTTGTAMGILRAMKERDPAIQVIGVEPYPGHKVQGLKNMKESYVPGIFDRYALDRVVNLKDEEAFEMARRLAREEGIFAGMSSGAAMAAAAKICEELPAGSIVVGIIPDGGDRYLSTNLFTTMLEPDFKFYNLLGRKKVDFKPVSEGKARIFVTGPPLDGPLSIEDSRRFILSDILARFLDTKRFSVEMVALFPDFDSRTIQGSIAAGMDLPSYARRQTDLVLGDLDFLGIRRANGYPRITDHTDTIIKITRELVDKGFAYEKLRSVYFNLCKGQNYGALSGIDPKKTRPGTTVDLDAYEKLNPTDFTLLKRATLAELKRGLCVKTDWGNVIPTWHIAAAAVATHDLGTPIDIQVGSVDFLFPHLENVREIAEAVSGKPFANIWMVCERVWSARGQKERGEIEEALPVRELAAQGYSPVEIRYWLLSTHYRKPIHASTENIRNTTRGLRRIQEFTHRLLHAASGGAEHATLLEWLYALEQNFFSALADDLNMPKALAELFRFIRETNPPLDKGEFSEDQRMQILDVMEKLDRILGIFEFDRHQLGEEERRLIAEREDARKSGNWDVADRVRRSLLDKGIRLVDSPAGTRWERVTE